MRDHELGVQLAEREVRAGDVRNQRQQDAAPCVLAPEEARLRGLVEPPDPAPDVELPAEVDVGVPEICRGRAVGGEENRSPATGKATPDVDLREELRPCDSRVRPELVDAPSGDPDVVAAGEGLVDQLLEDRVAEDIPPRLIGERRRRRRRSLNLAVLIRDREGGPLVVGADGAAREHGQEEGRGSEALHVSALPRRDSDAEQASRPSPSPPPWVCPCARASRPARRAPG